MKIYSAGCVCVDVFEELGEIRPGGEALNFCGNICGITGVENALISVVGDDEYARVIREKLSGYPIDVRYLHTEHGATANHRIFHTQDGDRWFPDGAWDGGVLDGFRLSDEDIAFISEADAVHTHFDSPLFPQILEARKNGEFLLAVDFNDYRDFSRWENVIKDIDLFFISGSAEEYFPDIMRRWSEMFPGVFTVTLAAAGSVSFRNGIEYRCAAVPVEKVVDTTGAGDSYIAGFTAAYAAGSSIEEAMKQGSLAASVNIARLGGF